MLARIKGFALAVAAVFLPVLAQATPCVPPGAPVSSVGCQPTATGLGLTDGTLAWQPALAPGEARYATWLQIFNLTSGLTSTGLQLPTWASIGRPTPPGPALGFNTTTGQLDVWTGSGWIGGGGGSGNWSAPPVSAVGSGLFIAGTTLTANWGAPAVSSLGGGLSVTGGALASNWSAAPVSAIGTGLSLAGGTLSSSSAWTAPAVSTIGTGLSVVGSTLSSTSAWTGPAVSTLGTGLSVTGTTLSPNWAGPAVNTLGTGLSVTGTTLNSTSAWTAPAVSTLGGGLSVSAGTLASNWSAAPVSAIGGGLSIASGTLSNTSAWTAPAVSILGSGLSITGTTLNATSAWTGPAVSALGSGLSVTGTTLSPNWTAPAVSALGTGLSITGTTLNTPWSGPAVSALGTGLSVVGTTLTPTWSGPAVSAIGAGLALTSGTLSATGNWTAGPVTALSGGLTITGTTLSPPWQAGTVTSLGTGLGIVGAQLQITSGLLPTIGSGHGLFNLTGSSAQPNDQSIPAALAFVFGSTQGGLLEAGATGWQALPGGGATSGLVLTWNGTGTDPTWTAPTAGNVLAGIDFSACISPTINTVPVITATNVASCEALPIAAGGTGGTTLATAQAALHMIQNDARNTNAAFNIPATDTLVTIAPGTAWGAPQTWTLPQASTVASGYLITVADQSGNLTPTNNLQIGLAHAGDHIRVFGSSSTTTTSVLLSAPNASITFASDGASNWSMTEGNVAVSLCVDSGTSLSCGEPIDVQTNYLAKEESNDGTTGTTQFRLAKLNASGNAIVLGTSDTFSIGLVEGTTGASFITGNAVIATAGNATCTFDAAATVGHYVTISSTTGGECHDNGATVPTSFLVGQVVSLVSGTNYIVHLSLGQGTNSGGGGGGGTTIVQSSFSGATLNPVAGDCGKSYVYTGSANTTVTLPITTALTTSCLFELSWPAAYESVINPNVMTLAINAADALDHGTTGTGMHMYPGARILLRTDAAGNWFTVSRKPVTVSFTCTAGGCAKTVWVDYAEAGVRVQMMGQGGAGGNGFAQTTASTVAGGGCGGGPGQYLDHLFSNTDLNTLGNSQTLTFPSLATHGNDGGILTFGGIFTAFGGGHGGDGVAGSCTGGGSAGLNGSAVANVGGVNGGVNGSTTNAGSSDAFGAGAPGGGVASTGTGSASSANVGNGAGAASGGGGISAADAVVAPNNSQASLYGTTAGAKGAAGGGNGGDATGVNGVAYNAAPLVPGAGGGAGAAALGATAGNGGHSGWGAGGAPGGACYNSGSACTAGLGSSGGLPYAQFTLQ